MNRLFLALTLLVCASRLWADSLEAILSRMDVEASAFHGMSADVTMLTFTQILSDKTTEDGTMKMQRLKPKDIRALIELSSGSDKRVLFFTGSKVRIYYPGLNTYQDYDMGKKGDLLNQYLLLGFGSSGKELSASYKISLEGTEPVEGKPASKLQLIPRDNHVLEHLNKVFVWIPEGGAYPVQQQFHEPSGNYRLVTYRGFQLNPSFGKGTLEFKMPSGAKAQQQ